MADPDTPLDNTRAPESDPRLASVRRDVFPQPFGRYQLLRLLGRGGMGAVYLAHDSQLDREVALKIPTLSGSETERILERFHREARAAATLAHANICPVYDVGVHEGTPYLTMAYVSGQTLAVHTKAGNLLPPVKVATLIRSVALAIHYAHGRGVIHRDLKPANILLNAEGEPIVMDFGLARRTGAMDVRITQSGQMMGTPAYMSPEQIGGDPILVGPGYDIYSLGVVLYELLTGRLPFKGSWTEVLAMIVTQKPAPPSSHCPDLPPALDDICLKALAKKPEERYSSMTEFASALESWTRTEVSPPTSSQPAAAICNMETVVPFPPARPVPRSRRGTWFAAGVVVLLLSLGALALYLLRPTAVGTLPKEPPKPRPFVDTREEYSLIRAHLDRLPAEARPHQRYFTLSHLHNDDRVSEADLRLQRAALAKTLNSLSWKPSIVLPEALGSAGVVYAIDLREFQWDTNLWDEVLKRYPYGLKHDRYPDDATLNDLARAVYKQTETDVPLLRIDWFVATVTRAPLYYNLLKLPRKAGDLEKKLKVDVAANFDREQLLRVGLSASGESSQNRLLERHDSTYGVYWRTYDFLTSDGEGDLLRRPLGPTVPDGAFAKQAFKHDGGEVLFSLPNGLHGYLIVNERDERLDEAPAKLVSDTLKTAGTTKMVAGLSCLACHERGVKGGVKDVVREGAALDGDAREKMRRLYRSADDLKATLDGDEQRFLKALEKTTGSFLRLGSDADKEMKEFPEPVAAVVRRHIQEVGLREAALELGLADPARLRAMIENNAELKRLGLTPLAKDGTIRREAWESLTGFNSPFQDSASALDLGTPKRVQ